MAVIRRSRGMDDMIPLGDASRKNARAQETCCSSLPLAGAIHCRLPRRKLSDPWLLSHNSMPWPSIRHVISGSLSLASPDRT